MRREQRYTEKIHILSVLLLSMFYNSITKHYFNEVNNGTNLIIFFKYVTFELNALFFYYK